MFSPAGDPAPFVLETTDWSGLYCDRVEMIQLEAFQDD